MKQTLTSKAILDNVYLNGFYDVGKPSKEQILLGMHEHTNSHIEALREKLIQVPEFFGLSDEIDKLFNEHLNQLK